MEEKVQPKFVLPPPKFDKPNGPSQANTHFLTPCGMTLLPRAKQPPPMYGARGATVPAKFLPKEQKVPSPVPETPPIYDCPAVPEHCYTCGMQLANSQDMKRHLEQHEECPAEDCDFAALHNILERHIEANHITGAYKKVKKVWTAEDLAAWRAERRKKYPTAANVELARLAKEQRIKRGERLEASKSRFGRREDRERSRGGQNKQASKAKSRQRRKEHTHERKKNQSSTKTVAEKREQGPVSENQASQAKQDEEDTSSSELKKFQGTGHMSDYKHLKYKAKKEDNAIFGLVGMYGSESDEETESDSEDSEEQKEDEVPKEVVSDITQPNDSSRSSTNVDISENVDKNPTQDKSSDVERASSSNEAPEEEPIQRITETPTGPIIGISENVDNYPTEEKSSAMEKGSSSDEAPEEEPIQRLTEATKGTVLPEPGNTELSDEAPAEEPIQRVSETINETLEPSTSSEATKPKQPEKRPAPKRFYGLNYKRARRTTPQNTMLSKLLAKDIIHERNVLLQCVRHVCQSNFFGIGQPPKGPPACDN
ncbi:hypothetical protein KR067_011741 [Drosophila pandora]|nr:hypothetical protein KR067_011741 [Drosophila pandora]